MQVGFPDPNPSRVGPLCPPSLLGWVLGRASPVLSVQGLRQSPSCVHLKPAVPPLGWTESERATLISPCPLSGHLGPLWVLPSLQAALKETEDFLKEHLFPWVAFTKASTPQLSRFIIAGFPRQPYPSNKCKRCACMPVVMNTYVCMFLICWCHLLCSHVGFFTAPHTVPNIDQRPLSSKVSALTNMKQGAWSQGWILRGSTPFAWSRRSTWDPEYAE